MTRRRWTLIAAVTLLVAACQNTPAPAPTPTVEITSTATPQPKGQIIKIYSSLPLSGQRSAQANAVVNAIGLAVQNETAAGTLCDGVFKIVHVSLDDASTVTGTWDLLREQDNAYKANADADAMAYIGPLDSDAARVSVPVLNQGSLAVLSPAADYIGLTKPFAPSDPLVYYPMGKRNFMRVVPPLDNQGAAAAKWAKSLGVTKAFLVDDVEQFGHGPSDAFADLAKQGGPEIAGRAAIDDKASNLAAVIDKAKATGADLVFFGGDIAKNAGQLLRELRKAGSSAKFMGTSAIITRSFVDSAADAAQGSFATDAGVVLESLPAKGQQFVQDYQSRFNSPPDRYAVYGYEIASVILASVQNVCLKDRVALLDAMYNTRDFDGALGKWSFDTNGDISLSTVVGGTFDNGTWRQTGALAVP